MRLQQLARVQQWWPIGLAREPMQAAAALLPPEWMNPSNDIYWLSFTGAELEPVPARDARTSSVEISTENHVIALGAFAEIIDPATGAFQAWAPMTAYLQDGTPRKFMPRPLPIRSFMGPSGAQPAWWPYRKFFRAGSQLSLTISSRALINLTVRPHIAVMEVYPR